jgi:hypothetical protein
MNNMGANRGKGGFTLYKYKYLYKYSPHLNSLNNMDRLDTNQSVEITIYNDMDFAVRVYTLWEDMQSCLKELQPGETTTCWQFFPPAPRTMIVVEPRRLSSPYKICYLALPSTPKNYNVSEIIQPGNCY